MPIFGAGTGKAPAWCELESFDLLPLGPGMPQALPRLGRTEDFIVCRGGVRFTLGKITAELGEGGKLDLAGRTPEGFSVCGLTENTLLFRAMGRWDAVTSSGIFTVKPGPPPANDTPYGYAKATGFDNCAPLAGVGLAAGPSLPGGSRVADPVHLRPTDAVSTEAEAQQELRAGRRRGLHLVADKAVVPAPETERLVTDAVAAVVGPAPSRLRGRRPLHPRQRSVTPLKWGAGEPLASLPGECRARPRATRAQRRGC